MRSCSASEGERRLVVIDHHEAPPDRPLVEAVCATNSAMPLGAETVLNLELNYGISGGSSCRR